MILHKKYSKSCCVFSSPLIKSLRRLTAINSKTSSMSFPLFSFELKEIFSSFPAERLECCWTTWCWPFEKQQKSRQRKNITLKWQKKNRVTFGLFDIINVFLFFLLCCFIIFPRSLLLSSRWQHHHQRRPRRPGLFRRNDVYLLLLLFYLLQNRHGKKYVCVLGRHHSATPRDNIFARNLMKQFFLLCCCCFASRRNSTRIPYQHSSNGEESDDVCIDDNDESCPRDVSVIWWNHLLVVSSAVKKGVDKIWWKLIQYHVKSDCRAKVTHSLAARQQKTSSEIHFHNQLPRRYGDVSARRWQEKLLLNYLLIHSSYFQHSFLCRLCHIQCCYWRTANELFFRLNVEWGQTEREMLNIKSTGKKSSFLH